MDLDGFLALILFMMHWRVAICIVGSTLLAIALVKAFSWFAVPQAIAIALLGFLPGAMWEAAMQPKSGKTDKPSTTSPTAAGGVAILVGGIWGACSASSTQSFVTGTLIFAIGAWGWAWYASNLQPPINRERVLLCIALAALIYLVASMVVNISF